jgi:hypothetical protein
MTHGFDLSHALVCEGIVGDGCGGGRIFHIQEGVLFAYDPVSKESIKLLENIEHPLQLSKKACIITIECKTHIVEFDLSLMRQTLKKF